MTTMPGNGPLPSGMARKPLTSSSPDLKVISFILTSAAQSGAQSTTPASTPRARLMDASSSKGKKCAGDRLSQLPCRRQGRCPAESALTVRSDNQPRSETTAQGRDQLALGVRFDDQLAQPWQPV